MENFPANILLVEDDDNLGYVLKDYLEIIGYTINLQKNGVAGFNAYKQGNFDLCILDIMMPIKDGFSLAEDIRAVDKDIPLIFLTARQMKEDKIRGFNLGADDYITKPFSSEELSLRIEAVLRRYKRQKNIIDDEVIHELGKFSFNYSDQVLVFNSNVQRLTNKESEVLNLLCQYKNKLIRREIVLKLVWGKDDYFMGRSMDVYITKLRKYLKPDPNITISNVHGTGFKLEVLE